MKLDFLKEDTQSSMIQTKVSLSSKDEDIILNLLTTMLYKNKLQSCIRELFSNAFDANVEKFQYDLQQWSIGKGITLEDIELYIKAKTKLTLLTEREEEVVSNIESWGEVPVLNPVLIEYDKKANWLKFTDFGVGLSEKRFQEVWCKVGSSTKRDGNNQIGGFGIGRFSCLLNGAVQIDTVYEGTKTTYVMTAGNNFSVFKVKTEEVKDIDGTTISVPLPKDTMVSISDFQILCNPFVIIKGLDYQPTKFIPFKNFILITEGECGDFISGTIDYRFDSNMGDSRVVIPVFEIGELQFTPSKEDCVNFEAALDKKRQDILNEIYDIMDNSPAFMHVYETTGSFKYKDMWYECPTFIKPHNTTLPYLYVFAACKWCYRTAQFKPCKIPKTRWARNSIGYVLKSKNAKLDFLDCDYSYSTKGFGDDEYSQAVKEDLYRLLPHPAPKDDTHHTKAKKTGYTVYRAAIPYPYGPVADKTEALPDVFLACTTKAEFDWCKKLFPITQYLKMPIAYIPHYTEKEYPRAVSVREVLTTDHLILRWIWAIKNNIIGKLLNLPVADAFPKFKEFYNLLRKLPYSQDIYDLKMEIDNESIIDAEFRKQALNLQEILISLEKYHSEFLRYDFTEWVKHFKGIDDGELMNLLKK